jgi:hypothetical protein
MLTFSYSVLIIIAILVQRSFSKMKWKDENEARGVLLLDGFTFEKIIPNEKFAVVVGYFKKGDIGKENKADNLRNGTSISNLYVNNVCI